DGMDALKVELAARALKDAHPGVRRHAIRLCEWNFFKVPDLAAALGKLAGDTDSQVRLQLAAARRECGAARACRPLGRLLRKDGSDRYLLATVLSSANKDNFSSMMRAALAGPGPVAPPVLAQLIRLTGFLGSNKDTVVLLTAAATPGPGGKYTPAQMETLA